MPELDFQKALADVPLSSSEYGAVPLMMKDLSFFFIATLNKRPTSQLLGCIAVRKLYKASWAFTFSFFAIVLSISQFQYTSEAGKDQKLMGFIFSLFLFFQL